MPTASSTFAERNWPDGVDATVIWVYCAIIIILPLVGYAFMVLDIRAYLRALRGMLVRVVYHFPSVPRWARYETPHCFRAMGLALPCSQADVKRAYRRLAEKLHPDRGGDPKKFLVLQRDLEAAMRFLAEHQDEWQPMETEQA